jgi:pyridoxine 5-phosphate synthase
MTRLSVNINKIALIRNARGNDVPNLVNVAKDCERYGAQGITVHPRPDERHVRFSDLPALKEVVTTEFNIEGYPSDQFVRAVLAVKPDQVTLVPDKPGQLTSDHGWDTIQQQDYLKEVVGQFRQAGIRVSLFIDPIEQYIEAAASTGADRVELYTGPYAHNFPANPGKAVEKYTQAARFAHECVLGINAGHDLNLDNLRYFRQHIPHLLEVSIGHALVCDALYMGLENSIRLYQNCLRYDM